MRFSDVYNRDIIHWQHLVCNPRKTRRGGWDCNKATVRRGRERCSLLAAAAFARNAALVELLVAEGSTMDGWTREIKNWAWGGCDYCNLPLSPECIRVFIALSRAGGNPYARVFGKNNSRTPFELLWQSKVDVRGLLPHPGMNTKHTTGQTPLHFLARTTRVSYEGKWNMDASNAKSGLVAAQLCAAGAAVNELDDWGDTPLDDAISRQNRAAARVLLRFGGTSRFVKDAFWKPSWIRFAPWSKNTHREAPPRIRGAVRALHFCVRAKHELPRLPDEMVAMICGHYSFLTVQTLVRYAGPA